MAHIEDDESDEYVVLLGDVGGTNIRLVLARIFMSEKEKLTVQERTIDSRSVQSFEEAVKSFLKVRTPRNDVNVQEFEESPNWPEVAVVGIAGPVDNNSVEVTNCPHWPPVDGEALSQSCNIRKFILLNDFAVAGL